MGREESRRTGIHNRELFFTVLLLFFIHADGLVVHDRFHKPTSHLKDVQLVTPQRVYTPWQRHHARTQTHRQRSDSESLIYSIEIENTVHFLHLTKNRDFLSPNFAVVSHEGRHNSVKRHKEEPAWCHYSGSVWGYEESLVALSTCSGLRGVIFLGNKSYALEPASHSTNHEHFLFPMENSEVEPFVCGVESEHQRDGTSLMGAFLRKKRNLPQTRYVELVLVVDRLRFEIKKKDRAAVKEEMVQLANLLDTYFKQLNIRIVLVGLEIFEDGNPFDVEGSAGEVLGRFVQWRKKNLITRVRNDMAQLIIGRTEPYSGGILGMAFVGTVCSAGSGGGISVFNNDGLQYYSTVLAHEMGHNLGMNHDTSSCHCDGNACIMNAGATGSTSFSSCSAHDFEALILRGGGVCLLNQPAQDSVISVPKCGNQILEGSEECDCGLPETCNNKCCDAATCTFTKGSVCAAGSCCKDCQLQVSGTPCRALANQCDLPEFCTGQSGFCPPDSYLMDSLTCESGTAYCFEGRCQTLDYQCRQLFGQTATKANEKCFSHVNTQGTKFGNCGYSGSTLVACSVANSMCGKIQCTNFDSNYPPAGAVLSIQNIEQGVSCRNADFNLGSDVLDPGYVKTGTVCATDKVCLNFNCVNSSMLTQGKKCDSVVDCNGNGVCNDKGHCHCHDGWAPPDCSKGGRGGSVDSGPAQIDYSLRNGLLIFFLLVLPVLVLVVLGLLYVFRRDLLTRCSSCWRSKRSRTDDTNAQRNNQPSTNVQIPPRPPPPALQDPQYPSITSGALAGSNTRGFADRQPANGPGVPRPIPPRNVVA